MSDLQLTNEDAPAVKKPDPKVFRPIKSISNDEIVENLAICLDTLIAVIEHTEPTVFANGVTDPLGTVDEGVEKTLLCVRDARNTLNLYRGQMFSVTPSQFMEEWLKSDLPPFRTMSVDRKRHLLARSKESFFVEHWREGIEIASNSAFCRGDNDRGWKANPDWFLRPGTLTKLLEGRYGFCDPKVQDIRNNMVVDDTSLDDAVKEFLAQ